MTPQQLDVFPASAGMSRFDDREELSNERVPRVSGDEPATCRGKMTSKTCSPRQRG